MNVGTLDLQLNNYNCIATYFLLLLMKSKKCITYNEIDRNFKQFQTYICQIPKIIFTLFFSLLLHKKTLLHISVHKHVTDLIILMKYRTISCNCTRKRKLQWQLTDMWGHCQMRYYRNIVSNSLLQLLSGMDDAWEWQLIHAWLTRYVPSQPTHPSWSANSVLTL